jgi:small subunit ribosomal protein S4
MLRGCRQCRREGEKLFLKGDRCLGQKCAVLKRPYPPGVHGPKGKNRLTDYAKQLREKQKARRYYQLAERQFAKYYAESAKSAGNTSELLWQRLELRLDNIIRRANLVLSLTEARQLVTHGMVTVNGKKLDIPSYQAKIGDKIALILEKELPSKQDLPEWISLDVKSKAVTVASIPAMESVETPFNINLVIEYYSK